MDYHVNLTHRAIRELESIHDSINPTESAGAARWFSRLLDTIFALGTAPRMGKVTREDRDVREVIYGKKPHLYRVLYEIDDSKQQIDVLSIWHGKRLPRNKSSQNTQ